MAKVIWLLIGLQVELLGSTGTVFALPPSALKELACIGIDYAFAPPKHSEERVRFFPNILSFEEWLELSDICPGQTVLFDQRPVKTHSYFIKN